MTNYMTETEKVLAWREHRNRVQRVRRRFWIAYGVALFGVAMLMVEIFIMLERAP